MGIFKMVNLQKFYVSGYFKKILKTTLGFYVKCPVHGTSIFENLLKFLNFS